MYGDCRAGLGWAPNPAGECRLVGGCPAQCDAACRAALFPSRDECQEVCMDEPMCGREASVDPMDPNASRYEAPRANNACRADDDCVVGGCGGEICAAEAVNGPCDVVPQPEGACGCVRGQCIWYVDQCGAPDPVECSSVAPGEYGPCERVLGWGMDARGQCTVISGCGCDATCEGRVFPERVDCERACLMMAEGDARCIPTPPGTYGRCRALLPVWTPSPNGGECVRLGGCPAECDDACRARNFPSREECEQTCLR